MDTKAAINEALKTVIDPELGYNIVDLGLVYGIEIRAGDDGSTNGVVITMTLTTPGCPLAPFFVNQVKEAVAPVAGIEVEEVSINLTFDPPWSVEAMSDEIRLAMGM